MNEALTYLTKPFNTCEEALYGCCAREHELISEKFAPLAKPTIFKHISNIDIKSTAYYVACDMATCLILGVFTELNIEEWDCYPNIQNAINRVQCTSNTEHELNINHVISELNKVEFEPVYETIPCHVCGGTGRIYEDVCDYCDEDAMEKTNNILRYESADNYVFKADNTYINPDFVCKLLRLNDLFDKITFKVSNNESAIWFNLFLNDIVVAHFIVMARDVKDNLECFNVLSLVKE